MLSIQKDSYIMSPSASSLEESSNSQPLRPLNGFPNLLPPEHLFKTFKLKLHLNIPPHPILNTHTSAIAKNILQINTPNPVSSDVKVDSMNAHIPLLLSKNEQIETLLKNETANALDPIQLDDDCLIKATSSCAQESPKQHSNADIAPINLSFVRKNDQDLSALKRKKRAACQASYRLSLKKDPEKFVRAKKKIEQYHLNRLKKINENPILLERFKKNQREAQIKFFASIKADPVKAQQFKENRKKRDRKRLQKIRDNPIKLERFRQKQREYQKKYIAKRKGDPVDPPHQ